MNYPLVKNLYAKSLISKEVDNVTSEEMAQKVSNLLYSQSNVSLTNKIFWKQSSYFDVSAEDLMFICDKACLQVNYPNKKGGFVSVGNFHADRDFVSYMPHMDNPI